MQHDASLFFIYVLFTYVTDERSKYKYMHMYQTHTYRILIRKTYMYKGCGVISVSPYTMNVPLFE